jgi:hypothetical protein
LRSQTHDTLEQTHGHQRVEKSEVRKHRHRVESWLDGVVVGVSDYHLLFSLTENDKGMYVYVCVYIYTYIPYVTSVQNIDL